MSGASGTAPPGPYPAAMAKKRPEGAPGKIAQLREAYRMTRQTDRKMPWLLLLAFALDVAIVLALGFALGHPIFGAIAAVLTGLTTVMVVFGNRVQKAAYAQVEGQPGAAAAVLNTIKRGGWTITPAVAVNKSQDVVHRAVGRPGIVLIGEGSPGRVGSLLEAERKRMNRFVADVPVHEVVVGTDEGEVPLPKLTKFLMRLPRTLKGRDVTEINDRLRALGDLMKNVPMPKGPMPKGMRMPKGPNPKMR